MFERPVMWLQAYRQGFSRENPVAEPTIKTTKNGGGTVYLPPPPKNSKISKSQNSNTCRNRKVKVKEQFLNILSTNAADLKYKAEDLKDKVRFFNIGIFAIQETHYRKKEDFH